jgi:8-oxo-dGTP pyrophosphatase MutT (NUDIX family)
VVLREERILTIRDPHRVHITPGGRREPGEELLDTVRREVLEETGWSLAMIFPLGFRHLHHLNPRPEGYCYPYPDFFHVLYAASAHEFQPEAREVDGWELEAAFRPVKDLQAADLTSGEALFLRSAWERLHIEPFPG